MIFNDIASFTITKNLHGMQRDRFSSGGVPYFRLEKQRVGNTPDDA